MNNQKIHISIVVIGNVDSGKSTTIGHLLYKMGRVSETQINQLEQEAEQFGKKSCKFAWILDKLKNERERGITIDLSLQKFSTLKFNFTIIDVPGHRDFMKNMVTGASQADCSLLVVSAVKGEFEAGICSTGCTKDHALLAFIFGIRQLVVIVNKMDDASVQYSQERFNEIQKELSKTLTQIGFNCDTVEFIPLSGFLGENLTEKSGNLIWYKGPTLIESLDKLNAPKLAIDKPLRIAISDVFVIGGLGSVPVGRVQTGVLKPGMQVMFAPKKIQNEVKAIEMHGDVGPQVAYPGDNVGFSLKNGSKEIMKGDVCGETNNNPPCAVESFEAQIIVMNHTSEIRAGYCPVIDCHTTHISCKFEELIQKIDKRTGQLLEKSPKSIKKGDTCLVKLIPQKAMCCEVYSEFPAFGRFAVRDQNQIVAVGIIKSCQRKDVKK